jgi:hypothetical protein
MAHEITTKGVDIFIKAVSAGSAKCFPVRRATGRAARHLFQNGDAEKRDLQIIV